MKTKLNKNVKKKWVEALRSGDFVQGTKALKNDGKFCCLGVACEIGLATRAESGDEFTNNKFLPKEIQEKLAGFNDGYDFSGKNKKIKKRSFKWIAAYIERYL